MIVTFAGTAAGMTDEQIFSFRRLLKKLAPDWLRHSDQVGAEQQAHEVAVLAGVDVEVFPISNAGRHRGWCMGAKVIHPPKFPETRDREILRGAAAAIIAPRQANETLHSSDWRIVRAARKANITVYVIEPEGAVRREDCIV